MKKGDEEDYRGMMETLYLLSDPEMREKLLEGKNTPLSECIPESEVEDWWRFSMLDDEVYDRLHETEIQAARSDKRFKHEEVITALRQQIQEMEYQ